MQLVRIHGPGDTRLDEVADPDPGPRDVVIDVAACGVCGSDLKYIAMGGVGGPATEPVPLGHEFSGTVSFVGAEVPPEEAVVGRRVVVNPGNNSVSHIGNGGSEGAFTRQVVVREAALGGRIFEVPDEIPFDVAALTEPIGVGMNAVDKAEIRTEDRVAIFGVGPIGLTSRAGWARRLRSMRPTTTSGSRCGNGTAPPTPCSAPWSEPTPSSSAAASRR